MLCTLPLTASDGTVMGVCGFEVSQMLFKLSYAPDNSRFEYLFCMLSPVEEGRLSAEGALYAGSYAVYPGDMTEQPLEIKLDTGRDPYLPAAGCRDLRRAAPGRWSSIPRTRPMPESSGCSR